MATQLFGADVRDYGKPHPKRVMRHRNAKDRQAAVRKHFVANDREYGELLNDFEFMCAFRGHRRHQDDDGWDFNTPRQAARRDACRKHHRDEWWEEVQS